VSKVQVTDSFSNVSRLFRIERAGLTFANRAKSTMARADVAAKHEGCGAIGPAFEDVGAPCFLTNRVKVQTLNKLQDVVLISRVAQLYAEPLGFGLLASLVLLPYGLLALGAWQSMRAGDRGRFVLQTLTLLPIALVAVLLLRR